MTSCGASVLMLISAKRHGLIAEQWRLIVIELLRLRANWNWSVRDQTAKESVKWIAAAVAAAAVREELAAIEAQDLLETARLLSLRRLVLMGRVAPSDEGARIC